MERGVPSTVVRRLQAGVATAQRGRNATERLLAIPQLVSAGKYPNTARMASEFEVSQKTVKRDVEWIEVALGFAHRL